MESGRFDVYKVLSKSDCDAQIKIISGFNDECEAIKKKLLEVDGLTLKEKILLLTEMRVLIMGMASDLDELRGELDNVISYFVKEGGLEQA